MSDVSNATLYALLERIDRRLEALEGRLAALEAAAAVAAEAPAMVATFTDVVDAAVAAAQAEDIDVDARARAAVELLGQLTEPDVLDALMVLTEALPRLAPIVEALPHTVATTVDVIDDFVARQQAQGVDVEAILTNMVTVATQVSNLLHTPEFGALMDSGVLAPRTLEVIGKAGQALADTRHDAIPKVGLLGALRAAGQGDVQRALGFMLTFAERFGRNLEPAAQRALAAKN
jgi:uncharacterized protein YjgD (DUF1641 family)